MKRIDQLKRSLRLYSNRVAMNKERMGNSESNRVKNNARMSIKKYEKMIKQVEKDIQLHMEQNKKEVNLDDILKVKNIVADFYGIELDSSNPIENTIGLNGKARRVLCYFITVYFRNVPQGKLGKAIGRKASTVSNGFNVCLKLKEEDILFKKELNNISSLIAKALDVEMRVPVNRRILKQDEAIEDQAIIRPSHEMPTILNEWLKPLRKNNLENKEVVKPVYF